MINLTNQKILIKTYCFESGLYYLAESLAKELTQQGNMVYFFPKAKYQENNGFFQRTYPNNIAGLKNVFSINKKISIEENIKLAVEEYKIDTIISLETLMEKSEWVNAVRPNVKVIDVPMIEWVSPKLFKAKRYDIFDEIWTITGEACYLFKKQGYEKTKLIQWNWVDSKLFFSEEKVPQQGVRFYHPGSLNPNHSTKNTEKVITAFIELLKNSADAYLYLTGKISDPKILKIIQKQPKIFLQNKVLSRQELANLYKSVDCVVAPSSQEGLGLSLYEAQACGCQIVTTNISPMNEVKTEYLCAVDNLKHIGKLTPAAIVSVKSIYQQLHKVYEAEIGKQNNNKGKSTKKTNSKNSRRSISRK